MRIRRPHILRPFRRLLRRGNRCGSFFAWLPVRANNGTWVWLEHYTRFPKRVRERNDNAQT